MSWIKRVRTFTNPLARFLNHSLPRVIRPLPFVENDGGHLEALVTPEQSRIQIRPRAYNPVLTASDVTDYGRVDFVADPFAVRADDGRHHMFFEVRNSEASPTAVIGHAKSDDGLDWSYDQVVLETDTHLSFPYVFSYRGDYYMIPDQRYEEGIVSLFRASDFPTNWKSVATIRDLDRRTSDSVVFHHDDRWWCLLGYRSSGALYVYYADRLTSDDWTPHADNPVVENRPEAARPGGRPLIRDNRIIVFYQNTKGMYGTSVSAYEITALSSDGFSDEPLEPVPLLSGTSGLGWNAGRMHHVDPWYDDGTDTFYCAVDGDINLGRRSWAGPQWSIGIYELQIQQ